MFKSLCTGVYQAGGGGDTHPVLGDSSVRPGNQTAEYGTFRQDLGYTKAKH